MNHLMHHRTQGKGQGLFCRLLLCLGLAPAVWAQSDYTTPYAFSTLAGVASIGSADGPGQSARFYGPNYVAVDAAGNVFVTDAGNHTVRKITPQGVVSTLAGVPGVEGSNDGAGPVARFSSPWGIAVDATGNVYVADAGNQTIRKITADGMVTTLAGLAGSPGKADGFGSAARFDRPTGVAVDAAGSIYVADTNNHIIRKILASGIVSTLAGTAGVAGYVDGVGGSASFDSPDLMAVDPTGNIYTNGHGPWLDVRNIRGLIRRITPAGVVTTVGSYRYTFPIWVELHGMAFDAAGNRYQTAGDNISKVAVDGTTTRLAGAESISGLTRFEYQDGPGETARFRRPSGIGLDAGGNVYIADDNNVIRKLKPSGDVSTFAGLAFSAARGRDDGWGESARFDGPGQIAVPASGSLLVVDSGVVRQVTNDGLVTTTDVDPVSLRHYYYQTDAAGNSYVADTNNHTILKTTPTGVVTVLAGSPGIPGSADGVGTAARFNFPAQLAVDPTGNVFVADTYNHTIRRITPAGMVSTLAGLVDSPGSAAGTGSGARFYHPWGIAVDAAGTLYVTSSTTVRVGRRAAIPTITVQPRSSSAMAGITVSFTVAAEGVPAPSYQWYFKGKALNGATSNELPVSASPSTAGDYTVTVTNDVGRVTSNVATLTVTQAPAPTPSSGGGGGGGAPGIWFLLTLTAITAMRRWEKT